MEEKIKINAKKYDHKVYDLEDVIEILQSARRLSYNIYIEFNGVKLYSMLDDRDSCYLKVKGMSYNDYLENGNQGDTEKE